MCGRPLKDIQSLVPTLKPTSVCWRLQMPGRVLKPVSRVIRTKSSSHGRPEVRSVTTEQIAWAIRNEVWDLE